MNLVCVKYLTNEEYKLLAGKAKKLVASDWWDVNMLGNSWKERNELLVGDGWYAFVEVDTGDSEEDNEYRVTIAIELKDSEKLLQDKEMEKLIKTFLQGKCTLG